MTRDLPGTGGAIKAKTTDFMVREIPLYPPSGTGNHTFFMIRKEGLTTFRAIEILSRELNVSAAIFGLAGIKDAQAVSWQVLSVEGIPPERILALTIPRMDVEWAIPHSHKLRVGHLKGNKFTVRISGIIGKENALDTCKETLKVLVERGVPNYYGPQRFGSPSSRSVDVGRVMVLEGPNAFKELVDTYLGSIPGRRESEQVRSARESYDAGRYSEASRQLPQGLNYEKRVLGTLAKNPANYRRAWMTIPKRLKRFFVSAFQSRLFNKVLDERLDSIDQVFEGDLAFKHDSGACFTVTDSKQEACRAKNFEISPTGPIFGYKMMRSEGVQAEIENKVLEEEGIGNIESFRIGAGFSNKGARRPLRFQVKDSSVSKDTTEDGDGDRSILISFTLAPGCYATTLLAEIMKNENEDNVRKTF